MLGLGSLPLLRESKKIVDGTGIVYVIVVTLEQLGKLI